MKSAAGEKRIRIIECVDANAMKLVAALMDDPQPIHWDEEVVRQQNLGSHVINQGPITVCYLLDLAAEIAGGPEKISTFRSRFLRNVFAGDRVECIGMLGQPGKDATITLEARVNDILVLVAEATIRDDSSVIQPS